MSTKKKSKKATTGTDMIKVGDRSITKAKYRDELLDELRATDNPGECKAIRNKLRTKCGHKGGLRTRTWTDGEGQKHHVETSTKSTTKKATKKSTKKKSAKKAKAR
jgi:hypothetical protein